MNKKELERKTMSLMGENYEGASRYYAPYGDPAISFEGSASSFSDEKDSATFYNMIFKNTGDEDVTVALCPGYYTDASKIKDSNGVAVDAIMKEGIVINTETKKLTATGKSKPIDDFLAFVKQNPTRMVKLSVQVDKASQMDYELYRRLVSPFRNMEDSKILPSVAKDPAQLDTTKVDINLTDYQFDDQTTITYTIQAGRTVTLTWFVGAIRNQALELSSKAKLAHQQLLLGSI